MTKSTEVRVPPGWRTVARKEIADHLHSARLLVVAGLLTLSAVAAVYAAGGRLRDVASAATDQPALFLKLFTVSIENTPFAFVNFVALIGPLLGIAFGFDAVSSERSQRTLPRLLAQPIHRDDVINGKFVAGLAVIGMLLTALMVLVAAIGIVRLGVVPEPDQIARLLVYLVVSCVYIGVWLAFALMLSILLHRAATAALTGIGTWLVFSLLAGLIVEMIAGAFTTRGTIENVELQQGLGRLSPAFLYEEVTAALLTPELRTLGVILPEQAFRAVPSQLPLGQSLLLVWPQCVALLALCVVVFAIAYVSFLRQEVRV
jgi:ABC-type transport system involved in multi-copper enzyme maturation, permease component